MSRTIDHPLAPGTHAMVDGFGSQRRPRLVVWLAAVGAFWAAYQLYGYWGWVNSPAFAPVPVGSDPVPSWMLPLIQGLQYGTVVIAVLVLAFLWRTCKREGRLSLEAMLALTGASILWQEAVYNWSRTNFLYNGYFFNMGNWTTQLPGWLNPTAHLNPVPLVFIGLSYVCNPVISAVVVSLCLNRMKARWPGMTVLQMVLVGFLLCALMDTLMELCFLRTQLYAYPNTIHALSLWGGKTYQFPLYEALTWPAVMTCWAMVYHFRDDRGHSFLDRGLDRVKSLRWHPLLRTLALIGFINSAYMVHNTFSMFFSFHTDATPAGYPSWLLTGQCGRGTDYECPGPNVPIPLPGSGPIPPTSGRN